MQTERRASILRAAAMIGAASLSFAAIAAPASAQRRAVVVTAAAPASEGARARATWLIEQAEAFDVRQGQDGRYFEVAKLYRTAANLRGEDTAAISNYRMAAWAYSAGGDNTAAFRVMKRAAELAAKVDDVERAIGSYVDAAMIAKTAGRTDHIAPLMREANTLLASEKLSAESRVALLERIEAEPVLREYLAAR